MSKGQTASKRKPAAARPGPARPPAARKKVEEKGMAKSAVAAKTKAKEPEPKVKEATPETPDSPLPLLDLSDAAVKRMIKLAKKRGYVTHEQLNAVLPAEEEAKAAPEEPEEEDDSDGELVEAKPKALTTKETKEPSERTDDPVRMY